MANRLSQRGSEADNRRANELRRVGCDKGDERACQELGYIPIEKDDWPRPNIEGSEALCNRAENVAVP